MTDELFDDRLPESEGDEDSGDRYLTYLGVGLALLGLFALLVLALAALNVGG